MKRISMLLIVAGLPLAACAPSVTSGPVSTDANAVAGFSADDASYYGAGAWAGPPPGRTDADRAARRAYYQGPRANEWF